MISNRQSRRRGRGGQRGSGNRQDNRSRGNAAQLLEKYKGLARDAQMSGDRVQQEYYLQFADHYFRVLEDHRISQEEKQDKQQSRQGGRGDKGRDDDYDDDDQSQQQEKPQKKTARQRKPKPSDDEQGEAQDKPKRRTRKKLDVDGGEAIADALPPAIGADDDDEDSEAA